MRNWHLYRGVQTRAHIPLSLKCTSEPRQEITSGSRAQKQDWAGEGAAPKVPKSTVTSVTRKWKNCKIPWELRRSSDWLLNLKNNICSEESNADYFGLRCHGANRTPVKFRGVRIMMDVFQCRLVSLERNESYTKWEPHLESSGLQAEPQIHPPGKASQPRRLRAGTPTRYCDIDFSNDPQIPMAMQYFRFAFSKKKKKSKLANIFKMD